jgi:predicted nucleic acid-binding protein
MRTVVLDTNVVLRLVHADPRARRVSGRLRQLTEQGWTLAIPLQVAVEFWVVATRPADVNRLGWSAAVARAKLDQVLSGVTVLSEPAETADHWLELVTSVPVLGKRAHDAKLAASLRANGLSHLLTLNGGDFAGMPGIVPFHPSAADTVSFA